MCCIGSVNTDLGSLIWIHNVDLGTRYALGLQHIECKTSCGLYRVPIAQNNADFSVCENVRVLFFVHWVFSFYGANEAALKYIRAFTNGRVRVHLPTKWSLLYRHCFLASRLNQCHRHLKGTLKWTTFSFLVFVNHLFTLAKASPSHEDDAC